MDKNMNMKPCQTDRQETFKIRTYYKTELAHLYLPHLADWRNALKQFHRWIAACPGLQARIDALGCKKGSVYYTPKVVRELVEAFGEP